MNVKRHDDELPEDLINRAPKVLEKPRARDTLQRWSFLRHKLPTYSIGFPWINVKRHDDGLHT